MISIGLIGYGCWGRELARNLAAAEGVKFVAIADHSTDRRCEASRAYPGVVMYPSGSALLSNDNLDAVVIATPMRTHHGLSKMAIEQGKHVLVEKPMAASVSEAVALGELAEKHGIRLMVDHTFLFDDSIRKIRSLIEDNEIGSLVYLDSVRTSLGLFRADTNVIWDLAVHDIAITEYLFDEPPTTISVHGARLAGHVHEHIAHITLRFSEAVIAHFHVNWLAPGKVRRIVLCGSRRMIVYDGLEPRHKVWVHDAGIDVDLAREPGAPGAGISYRTGSVYAPRVAGGETLSSVVREFVEAIDQRRRPFSDANTGIRVVEILEAAERSLRAGGSEVRL